MKALIVGGGSVGRFIAEQLGATGHTVVILDNDAHELRNAPQHSGILNDIY